jgi:non-specific serine/threonine protein kinase
MTYLEESLQVWRGFGDLIGTGSTLQALAEIAILQGQLQRAIALLEECLAVSRGRGEPRWVAEALHNLARLVLDAGDWRRAAALLRESLGLDRSLNEATAARRFLEDSVGVALARGAWTQAARLLGAVETARAKSGPNIQSVMESPYAGRAAEMRVHLGANAFATAWAEGQALAVEQAVAYALAAGTQPDHDDSAPHGATLNGTSGMSPAAVDGPTVALTPRELEVLQLVAQGYTDQAVATHLGLRPRTVSSYLRTIYGKLGVRTRTAAAHWLSARGLP